MNKEKKTYVRHDVEPLSTQGNYKNASTNCTSPLPVVQNPDHDFSLTRTQISAHGRMNLNELQFLVQTGVDDVLVYGIHDQILELTHVCNLEVGQQIVVWESLNMIYRKDGKFILKQKKYARLIQHANRRRLVTRVCSERETMDNSWSLVRWTSVISGSESLLSIVLKPKQGIRCCAS